MAAAASGAGADAMPAVTDFVSVRDASCAGCDASWVAGEWRALVEGGADNADTAYGLKDFAGSAGWSGRLYSRTLLRLGLGQTVSANLAVLQVRDAVDALVYELYVAGADRTLRLWSPAGGLRSSSINESTGVAVPNDGTAVRAEVSALANDSVVVRVDGADEIAVSGLAGATTGSPRYLRVGIEHYDSASASEPVTVFQGSVGVSTDGWLGVPAGLPVNVSPPSVSGVAQSGQTLQALNGEWTGATGFAYQWRRCAGSGGNCVDISGATGGSYLLASGDVGSTIRVAVTASSSAGAAFAVSAATAVVTGTASMEQLGKTSAGASSGAPGAGYKFGTTFTLAEAGTLVDFKFYAAGGSAAQSFIPLVYSVDASGAPQALLVQGAEVTVAASQAAGWVTSALPPLSLPAGTYLLGLLSGPASGGASIYLDNVAGRGLYNTNAYPTPSVSWGSSSTSDQELSVYVDYVSGGAAAAPANTAAPSVSGVAQVGRTLTATPGSWTGSPSYAYQWRRCDPAGGSCSDIGGATNDSYLLAAADLGSTVRVVVTGSNGAGSASASSAATPVVVGSGSISQFGKTTPSSASASPGANYKFGSRYTLAEAGTLVDFKFYAAGGSAPQTFISLVYTVDASGNPASLVAQGAEVTVAAAQPAGWVTSALPATELAAGQYVLALLSGPTSGGASIYFDNVANTGWYNTNAYPTPSSSWGATSTEGHEHSYYVDYVPGGAPATAAQFGKALPSIASAAPGANYKFGSKYTLAEPGTVVDFKFYAAGGFAAQSFVPLVYTVDASGNPASLLAQGAEVTVAAGQPAGWVTSALPPVSLPAGDYLLALLSGPTSAGSSIYFDNVANTGWYNTNAYPTPSSSWGATSTEGHEHSYYVDYVPEQPDLERFGKTTVSAASGMSGANYKFGSKYTLAEAGRLVDFKFYAAGGASAQTLIPLVYSVDASGNPADLLAQGAEVTVAAAQAAGWVTSALPPVSLPAGDYLLALLSGPTSGSASIYFDNVANTGWYNTNAYPTPSSSWGATSTEGHEHSYYVEYVAETAAAAPANTVPPAVSGMAQVGQTLSATPGSWTGSPSFAYRWRRCDGAGAACVEIGGATSGSYTLAAADLGSTIRVRVSATGSGGSTAVSSAATPVVIDSSSLAQLGKTTAGASSGAPGAGYKFGTIFALNQTGTLVDFKFYAVGSGAAQRFVPVVYSVGVAGDPQTLLAQGAEVTVGGSQPAGWATASLPPVTLPAGSYLLGLLSGPTGSGAAIYLDHVADSGWYNTNPYPAASTLWGASSRSDQQLSVYVDYQPGQLPTNTAAPGLTGSPVAGQTLSASPGSWSPAAGLTFAYRWLRCAPSGEECAEIAGATAASYTLTADDEGKALRVRVTATSSAGAGSATSSPTALVVAGLPSSIAALGDSLTQAWGSSGAPGSNNPTASWSTGTDTDVNSQYERLLALNPAISGQTGNDAVSGSKMAATYEQAASAIGDGAEFVTLLSGTNDVCTATTAGMTSVAAFTSQLTSTLTRLTTALPGTRILVASIPDWYGLWQQLHTNAAATSAWATYGACPALLGASATSAERQAVGQRIDELNEAAAETCAGFAQCRWDGGAIHGLSFTAEDLAFDYFHLSPAGQARLAAATWNSGLFSDATSRFGQTTPGASSGQPGAGYKFVTPLTLAEPGTTVDLRFYAAGGSAAQVFRPVIYSMSGGQPDQLLAEGDEVTVAADQPAGWVSASLPAVWLPAGSYALGLHSGPASGGASIYLDNVAGSGFYNVDDYPQATPSFGSASSSDQLLSVYVELVPGSPPVSTTLPTVTGTAAIGQTLAASEGGWSPVSGSSYSYQWRRCDAEGANCADIAGATGASYLLAAADEGSTIRVRVSASNSAGSASASSAATAAVLAEADLPVLGDLAATLDAGCAGCSFTIAAGEYKATIAGGADTLDTAYGLKDFAGPSGWSGRSYVRSVLRLDEGRELSANLSVFQLRDVGGRLIYELYLARDGSLRLASPGGGLRASSVNASTGTLVPNDGTPIRVEVSALANDSIVVRVDGDDVLTIGGLSGATTAGARSLRAGVDHYDATTNDEPVTVFHSSVGVTLAGWLGVRELAAPANTALPSISGYPQVGQTLSADPGSWAGTAPIGYRYQWRRCDAAGASCADIPGATASQYSPVPAQLGSTLRVAVTAKNGAGTDSATSGASAEVAGPAHDLPVIGSFTATTDTGCGGCSFASASGEWQATIAGGADSLDTAYGLSDFGGALGWQERLYLRDTLRLPAGFAIGANLVFLQLRDVDGQILLELFLDPSRKINFWAPAGALQASPLFGTTGEIAPNDGTTSARIEVSVLRNVGVVVRVDGAEKLRLRAIAGATRGSPRYLRAGIDHYDTTTTNEPVTLFHKDVGVSTISWLGTRTATGNGPASTTLPGITGTVSVGETLTASTGSWSGSPTVYDYQWLRCDTYGQAVRADRPAGYWRLGERGSGSLAADLSGQGNDASYVGGATRAAAGPLLGDRDTAVSFDGSSGYLLTGFEPDASKTFTLEAWVKVAAAQPDGLILGASGEPALALTGGGKPQIRFPGGGSQYTLTGAGSVADDAWHQLVGVWDGTRLRLYVDGALAGSLPLPDAQPDAPGVGTEPLAIAGGPSAQTLGYLAGTVDEAAYYPTALDASRIAAHHAAATTSAAGACSEIPDATGSTHTLTADDAGYQIRVRVAAANTGGAAAVLADASDATDDASAPGTPQLSLPEDATTVKSLTPVLSASGSDADGDLVSYQYQLAPDTTFAAGTLITTSPWSPGAGSWGVPLAARLRDGQSFYWRVRVRDPFQASAWSTARRLSVSNALVGARDSFPLWRAGPLALNEASGNLILSLPGPSYPTAAAAMAASFVFNSLQAGDDSRDFGLGNGWTLDVGHGEATVPVRLVDHASEGASDRQQAVEVVRADGGSDWFQHVGGDVYVAQDRSTAQLARTASGWRLLAPDGTQYTFGATDANGVATPTATQYPQTTGENGQLDYQFNGRKIVCISDGSCAGQSGRSLRFKWNSLDPLACTAAILCVEGPDGVVWRYVGDGFGGTSGRIQLVTRTNGSTTRQLLKLDYDTLGRPWLVQNANDLDPDNDNLPDSYDRSHHLEIGYDPTYGRVVSVGETGISGQTPGTSTWTFDYHPGGSPLTSPAENSHQNAAAGLRRKADGYTLITSPVQRAASQPKSTKLLYDADGQTMEAVDPLGRSTQVSYDRDGRLLWSEDALGQPSDYAYDPVDDVLVSVTGPDPDGSGPLERPVTRYRYDETAPGTADAPGPGVKGLQVSYYDTPSVESSTPTRKPAYLGTADLAEKNQLSYAWAQSLDQFYAAGMCTQTTWCMSLLPDGIPWGSFSVRWSGDLNVPEEGDYILWTYSTDGTRVVVDQTLAVDAWRAQEKAIQTQGAVHLTEGWHRLQVVYFHTTNPQAEMRLGWSCWTCSPGFAQEIPATVLRPAFRTLTSTISPGGRLSYRHYASPLGGQPDYELQTADGQQLITSYTYDSLGRLTQAVSPRGNASRTIDSAGNLTGSPNTDYATGYAYYAAGETAAPPAFCGGGAVDQAGQLKTTTPPGLAPVSLVYDAAGRQLARTDGAGTSCSSYDGEGRLASVKDANAHTTSYAYDPAGNGVKTTFADGSFTTTAYDESGAVVARTNENGQTTSYVHDADGRLSQQTGPLNRTSSYSYDAAGNRLTSSDPLGNTTSFTYDQLGRLVLTRSPLGNEQTRAYDGLGRISSRIDPRGNTTGYTYTPDGERSSVTDPLAATTSFAYDTAGRLVSTTDPLGRTTGFTYDRDGNQTAVTAADNGGTTNIAYDPGGRLASKTDPLGHATTYAYDTAGRLVSATLPTGQTSSLSYDPVGNTLTSTDAAGKTTSYAYDARDRRTRVTTPSGAVWQTGYDPAGQVVSRTDPLGKTTSIGYDAAGRQTTLTDPLGGVSTTGYDAADRVTSTTDPNNHTTSIGYDADGRPTSVTAPAGGTTSLAYDPAGNLVSRSDPLNHATTYTYDDAGRLVTRTDPLGRTWTYSYDANGNRSKLVDGNGNATPANPDDGVTRYTYDPLGRVTGVDYADATADVSFAYDLAGRRTSIADGAGTQTYGYDNADRLTTVTRGSQSFAYTYDSAGRLASRSYPDGSSTSYTYDDDSRLATVTAGAAVTQYAYDQAGRLIATTLPNGWSEQRSYDDAGRLSQIQSLKGTDTLAVATYTRDPVGNPTQIVRDGTTETYAYDQNDRITAACYAGQIASCPQNQKITYGYDQVGNRQSQTRYDTTTSYTYDNADQLTQTVSGGTTTNYSYDANGNQTGSGTRTFSYDLANRLTQTTEGASTVSFTYDGLGNRLTKTAGTTTTGYAWDENNPLPQLALEQNGATTLRSYSYGLDLVSMQTGGGRFYYHHDDLGSTAAITNSTGAIQWTYTYDPYGNERNHSKVDPTAPDNTAQFTGELLDPETGLYDLRARLYDPSTGRFLSQDPVPEPAGDPALSDYLYANDRPTLLTDPSGLRPITDDLVPGDVVIWKKTVFFKGGATTKPGVLAVAKQLGSANNVVASEARRLISEATAPQATVSLDAVNTTTLAVRVVKAELAIGVATAQRDAVIAEQKQQAWEDRCGWHLSTLWHVDCAWSATKNLFWEHPDVGLSLLIPELLPAKLIAGLARLGQAARAAVLARAGTYAMRGLKAAGLIGGRSLQIAADYGALEARALQFGVKPGNIRMVTADQVGPLTRTARDFAVDGRPAPGRLPLEGRSIGRGGDQDDLAGELIKGLGPEELRTARLNQTQVGSGETRLGVNVPDLQWASGRQRYYVEVDRSTSGRGMPHAERILANDPNGVVILITYP